MKRTIMPRVGALVLATAFLAATPGCSCDGDVGFGEQAPEIEVTPDPVVYDMVPARQDHAQVLRIRNAGKAPLELDGEPVLVENGEDAETEFFLRPAYLEPVDCLDGTTREGDALILQPNECSQLTLFYFPQDTGPDSGSITFKSNDAKNPELVVPIQALASAADIRVCMPVSDCTDTELCWEPGLESLNMVFPLTQIGEERVCPLRIDNLGELDLTDLGWTFKSGNRRRDYILEPDVLGELGDIASGAGVEVNVKFKPKSGGSKEALLEITSSDPDESAVTIRVDGLGDGPKVCPDPFPTVDFGDVAVTTTKTIDVALTNCGTQALDITHLEVQNATGSGPSGEYALQTALTMPIHLEAGESASVPVDFVPPVPGLFNARLYLESTDPVVPSGWVVMTGKGVVPPACRLQSSTSVVSFGTTAPGYPVEKTVAIANPGELDCSGVTAQVSAGSNVRFFVSSLPPGAPPYSLPAGQTMTFKLKYDPADENGPDQGTFSITGADVNGPVPQLDVQLVGTPTDAPACDLVVTPRAGNFSFNECAVMSMTPRVAQFGAVRISQEKNLNITLQNVGSAACGVTEVAFASVGPMMPSSPEYTLVSPVNKVMVNGQATNVISPGQTGVVQVRYEPVNEEVGCGSLKIQTSHTDHQSECTSFGGIGSDGCYSVSLMGQGVRSAIEVIPGEVDFGLITVGCASRDREVAVYNIGQAPLNITSIYIDPTASPFSLTSAPPLPVTVGGGQSIKLRVKYRPPDESTHSGLLVLESDAQNANIMTVPLTGTGTLESHQVDTFDQLSEPLVDVLWIVDDSCSMSEEQSNIANNAQSFLSRALSLQTDFQIGVVTTDMEDAAKSGKLQSRNGRPKIITRNTADPVAAFKDNVRQGTSGDATEKGLEAGHRALSDPLINDVAANEGFLRDDAKLVMITVSDEEDSSTPQVDFYVDFFKNIKGYRNADLMSFSAIVGPEPSGCSSSDGDAVAGTRYLEVARRTGGLERPICTTDWGQIADDLGLDAFGAKSQFFLTRDPVVTTINVRVNGQASTSGTWSYDAPSNSIIFDPTAVPPQGATITVEYDTVCH